MKGIEWSVKRPVAVILIFAALMVAGVLSYMGMSKQENPQIAFNGAVVTTVFPGAGSEEVERLVTNPLEKEVKSLTEVDRVESFSLPNVSILQVIFQEGEDLQRSTDRLKEKIESASNRLPESAEEPEVNAASSETALAVIHLSRSGELSWNVAERESKKLTDRLENLPGISRTEIIGLPERQIHVSLDLEKLEQYNLMWQQVFQTLRGNDVAIPEGAIRTGDVKAVVETQGALTSPDAIEEIPLGKSPLNGKIVKIKDVADVEWGYESLASGISTNGDPSISIVAYGHYDIDARELGKKVREEVAAWKAGLPKDYRADVVFDQSRSLEKRFDQLYREIGIGMSLVVLVCLVGLAIRSAIMTSLSIPVTLLVSFFFLDLWGVGIHQISLASLILVLGILVDDSIVVNENMERHLRKPGEAREHIIAAIREVAPSIVIATLTTIVGFAPVYFLEGDTGAFIQAIPQVVIVTLLMSMVVSLYFLPALRARTARRDRKPDRFWAEKGWNLLSSFYASVLKRTLRISRTFAVLALLVSSALLGLTFLLPFQFFPEAEEQPFLVVDIVAPQGTDLEKTRQLLDQTLKVIDGEAGIKNKAAYLGQGLPRVYYNEGPPGKGESVAQILLELDEESVRDKSELLKKLRDRLNDRFEDTRVMVRSFMQGPPVGAPIQIRITGEDLDRLRRFSAEVSEKLRKIDHVMQVQSSFGEPVTKVQVEVDHEKASSAGITPENIALANRFALQGLEIADVYIQGEAVPVLLKASEKDVSTIEDLEELPVAVRTGNESGAVPVALKDVARLSEVKTDPQITHYNHERSVEITAYVDEESLIPQVNREVERMLRSLSKSWPEGYEWSMAGQEKERSEAFSSLYKFFILSAFLIFILIYIQFQSFRKPLIIMTCVYMAVGGAVLGLYLTDRPFGFMALLGILGLSGVVVRNGIMLVDFVDASLKEGRSLTDSLVRSGQLRLRPILLTTGTSVGALIPMAILGGNLWSPLAIAIIGGLLYSTFLTLLVVPCLYYAVMRKQMEKQGALLASSASRI